MLKLPAVKKHFRRIAGMVQYFFFLFQKGQKSCQSRDLIAPSIPKSTAAYPFSVSSVLSINKQPSSTTTGRRNPSPNLNLSCSACSSSLRPAHPRRQSRGKPARRDPVRPAPFVSLVRFALARSSRPPFRWIWGGAISFSGSWLRAAKSSRNGAAACMHARLGCCSRLGEPTMGAGLILASVVCRGKLPIC
jgi:hypothetical protein